MKNILGTLCLLVSLVFAIGLSKFLLDCSMDAKAFLGFGIPMLCAGLASIAVSSGSKVMTQCIGWTWIVFSLIWGVMLFSQVFGRSCEENIFMLVFFMLGGGGGGILVLVKRAE